MESTTLVPLPLLCALETSVLSVEVEPESKEIPEDELGVANASRRPTTCQQIAFAYAYACADTAAKKAKLELPLLCSLRALRR